MASTRFFYRDLTQGTPRKATENSESFGQNRNTVPKPEGRFRYNSLWILGVLCALRVALFIASVREFPSEW